MANESTFYPPPQPTQGRRFVPIPAQGQQPPFGPRPARVTTDLIRQSWEPPDPQPYQRPLTIAPLRIVYGNQPPLGNWPAEVIFNEVLRVSWEPPPPTPWQRPLTIAPLRIVYGSQPPPRNDALKMETVLASWPTGFEYQAPQLTELAATITLPPVVTFVPFVRLPDHVFRSWEAPLQVTQPVNNDAPLSLVYGDQPPKMRAAPMQWQYPDALPQQARPSIAPLIASPPVVTFTPFTSYPLALIQSWQAIESPQQRQRQVAPLTLTYGQQPPRYSTAINAVLSASWLPSDPSPQQRLVTRPIPSVVSLVPFVPYPMALVQSWNPPEPMPAQRPLSLAPLTIRYGDQPPKYSPAQMLSLLSSWVPPDPMPYQRVMTITATIAPPPPPGDPWTVTGIWAVPALQGSWQVPLVVGSWEVPEVDGTWEDR